MSNAPNGYRWMVSPDGYNANLVREEEVKYRYQDWTDCTEMTDAEVMKLMERRMYAATNNEQLQLAA